MPGGNYYVRTANSLGFINKLWNNIPCPCSVTSGTIIVVGAGTVPGISFALTAGGSFTGTVTNAAGGGLLQNVTVNVYNSSGTNTNMSGVYTTAGFPAGTYYARTFQNAGFVDQRRRALERLRSRTR